MGLVKQENTTVQTELLIDKPGDIKVSYQSVNKDRRILVQGILQAVVQSQGLLLEPGTNFVQKVKDTTLELVRFVEENSK